MTVEQFAAAVKVKPSTIVDWSKGRTRPQPRNLKRLASVLRIPIREVSAMF